MTKSQKAANEYAIEEVLSRFPHITERVLDLEEGSLTLANRQQSLPSGRSDLVFLSGSDVYLLELKAVPAKITHLDQIERYIADYRQSESLLQASQTLVPVLLAPEISSQIESKASENSILTREFDFEEILRPYTQAQSELLSHYEVGGIVTSVARLGLTHGLLYYLADHPSGADFDELGANYNTVGKGTSTRPADRARDLHKVTAALGLTAGGADSKIRLNDLGQEYVSKGKPERRRWQVTRSQARLLTRHLLEDPFANDLTYSLLALLKSVFELSRNRIPVSQGLILDWYTKKVGKDGSWSEGTQKDVVNWLGDTLEEMQLLIIQDDEYYLTPQGYDALSYFAIEEGKSMIMARSSR
jgi:hypothetical protein